MGSKAAPSTIDPSAALRTPVRAGPNGADRVLGDKERRVMEIFFRFWLTLNDFVRIILNIIKYRIQNTENRTRNV